MRWASSGPSYRPPARGSVHPLEGQVRADVARTVNLDHRPVDRVVEHAGDVEPVQGGLDPCLAALVRGPGGVEDHQAGCLDMGGALGDVALDLSQVAEQRAVGVAEVDAVARQLRVGAV